MKQGNGGGEREGVCGILKTSPSAATTTSGARRRRGAQPGNTQALKHGRHKKEIRDALKMVADWKRTTRALLAIAKEQLADDNKQRRHKIIITRHGCD
jgi:hypothetical protein